MIRLLQATALALVASTPRALSAARLELDYARARPLHAGDATLPPLVELPAALGRLPLRALVAPPSVDDLWEWCAAYGRSDADPSWARVWPTAAALAAAVYAQCAHLGARDAPGRCRGRRLLVLCAA